MIQTTVGNQYHGSKLPWRNVKLCSSLQQTEVMEETTKTMVMRETLKPPGTKKATIGGMIQTTVVGTEAIGTMKTPKNGTTTGAKKNVVVKTLTTMNVGTDV